MMVVGRHQSLAALSGQFAIDLTGAGCYISRSICRPQGTGAEHESRQLTENPQVA